MRCWQHWWKESIEYCRYYWLSKPTKAPIFLSRNDTIIVLGEISIFNITYCFWDRVLGYRPRLKNVLSKWSFIESKWESVYKWAIWENVNIHPWQNHSHGHWFYWHASKEESHTFLDDLERNLLRLCFVCAPDWLFESSASQQMSLCLSRGILGKRGFLSEWVDHQVR